LNLIGIRTADREKVPEGESDEEEETDKEESTHNAKTISDLGFYDKHDKKFYIRSGAHGKFFTHFKNFYIHRVQHVGLKKKQKSSADTESRDTHKPTLSKKTQKLAENKRNKMAGDKKVSHVEILLMPKHNKEKLEAQRKERE